MLVALERNKFTYLYKYNQIRVDINQVIDEPVENLKWMLQLKFNELLLLFNKAIPLFEQDHEILLLEVDKSKIKFHNGLKLSFDSIHCIYPITIIGGKLLDGKISDDFIVEHPVFEKAIEWLKIIRSMEFRRATSEKLLAHFDLATILKKELISSIEAAVKKNLLDKNQSQVFTTFLDHLIAYNKTPSYIPDGNIEHICKIGAITIKYLGKPEEVFTNGPFYKSSLKYKSLINNKSYTDSYLAFISITDVELKTSFEKIVELISKDYHGVDLFKVTYFFLAFKSFINKNDNNIESVSNEIVSLISQDRNTAAFVLSLIGYTFSFENIYEGIHRLSNAPLLKSTTKKIAAKNEKEKSEKAAMEEKIESERKVVEREITKLKQDKKREEIKTEETETFSIKATEKNDKVKGSITFENIPERSIENETTKEVLEITESEAVGIFPNEPIEKTKEVVITNSNEKISEPIIIYDVNEPKTKTYKVKLNIKDSILLKEEQNINGEDILKEKSTERELLTVQVFRNYLLKELKNPKQKIWLEVLDQFFPSKYEEISLESLLDKLDTVPEVKDKILNTSKDRKPIKAFFDTYK
jgi:hypothetical protein